MENPGNSEVNKRIKVNGIDDPIYYRKQEKGAKTSVVLEINNWNIKLSNQLSTIFLLLIEDPDATVSSNRIKISMHKPTATDNHIQSLTVQLRSKINNAVEKDYKNGYVHPVRNIGYRFNPTPKATFKSSSGEL